VLVVDYSQLFEAISDCTLRLLDPTTAYITASTLSILGVFATGLLPFSECIKSSGHGLLKGIGSP
jgi:hypothetical protein